MNEILSYVPRPNILELKGVMTKQQVKDYILSLPDGTFDDNCQVLNDENGTAIRYGHSAKNVWSLSMPASFSFTCQSPSQISFKCRYSDTGRSLFQGGFLLKDSNKTYYIIQITDESSSSGEMGFGGVYINCTSSKYSSGTKVLSHNNVNEIYEYTWINNDFVPKGTYTFEWHWDITHVSGDGKTITANPTYFDYFIMEF